MVLLHSDVRRILEILERSKHLDHVEITIGDYVLKAGKSTPMATDQPPNAQATAALTPEKAAPATTQKIATAPQNIPAGMIALRAPMAGTFYLTPSPDEPAFVSLGDKVAEGDTICLVEVMKMFNSIPAPQSGTIHQIIARHGQTVTMDEAIMILKPESSP